MVQTYQEQSLLIARILYEYALKQDQEKPGGNQIVNYYAQIHEAFYKLKRNHPDSFKRLFFDTNGHKPFSKELDSIIQDLQISGVINKLNPTFNTLLVNINKTKVLIDSSQEDAPSVQEGEFQSMIEELAL